MSNSSAARLEILTRINRAIRGVSAPSVPPYPLSAPLSAAEQLCQFEDRIVDYKAAFIKVDLAGVPQAVAAALGAARQVLVPAGLPAAYLPGPQDVPGLKYWQDEPPLSHAQLDGAEAVITTCAVAVSETGTIILDHSEGQGRRALSLIPDQHVCIIQASQVVTSVLEGVRAVQPSVQQGRPLTWISGPSATSDIELVRVEGVHGPRRLSVILVSA